MTPSQLKHTQFVMFSAERNRILSTLQTRTEVTRGANLCRVRPAERALFSHCRTLICTDTAPGLPLRSETSTTVQNIAARQRCKCQRKSAEDRSEGTQRRGSSSTQPPGAAARPPPSAGVTSPFVAALPATTALLLPGSSACVSVETGNTAHQEFHTSSIQISRPLHDSHL